MFTSVACEHILIPTYLFIKYLLNIYFILNSALSMFQIQKKICDMFPLYKISVKGRYKDINKSCMLENDNGYRNKIIIVIIYNRNWGDKKNISCCNRKYFLREWNLVLKYKLCLAKKEFSRNRWGPWTPQKTSKLFFFLIVLVFSPFGVHY